MSRFCGSHRVPRAGVDPIDSAAAAFAVVQLALRRPLAHETVAVVLDADRRGRSILVVDGTVSPDAVVDVAERVAEHMRLGIGGGALVLASVRPHGGPEPGDVERWLEASELSESAGVELLEWFVIDRAGTPTCPRDLLGEAPRW